MEKKKTKLETIQKHNIKILQPLGFPPAINTFNISVGSLPPFPGLYGHEIHMHIFFFLIKVGSYLVCCLLPALPLKNILKTSAWEARDLS